MFSEAPDDDHFKNIFNRVVQNNSRHKRQKKLKRKNKQKSDGVKRDLIKKSNVRPPVPLAMSAWAENFTIAATWQLKQQIAYWKSKAIALEYENKMLHDIIRENRGNVVPRNEDTTTSNSENDETDELDSSESEIEPEQEEVHEEGDFEVSEEFIQFLRENKKYRDDAKREREKLKGDRSAAEKATEALEAGPPEDAEDPQKVLKRLYGDGSDRIAALESSLRSNYINFCDREKPMYWPNIPFNFSVGA